jgi:apolipoprotein N-acyltransferase
MTGHPDPTPPPPRQVVFEAIVGIENPRRQAAGRPGGRRAVVGLGRFLLFCGLTWLLAAGAMLAVIHQLWIVLGIAVLCLAAAIACAWRALTGLSLRRRSRLRRFHWWDGALWWRTYTPGGFDGYRTTGGRRLPCATMLWALERPGMRAEIRVLSRRRWR